LKADSLDLVGDGKKGEDAGSTLRRCSFTFVKLEGENNVFKPNFQERIGKILILGTGVEMRSQRWKANGACPSGPGGFHPTSMNILPILNNLEPLKARRIAK